MTKLEAIVQPNRPNVSGICDSVSAEVKENYKKTDRRAGELPSWCSGPWAEEDIVPPGLQVSTKLIDSTDAGAESNHAFWNHSEPSSGKASPSRRLATAVVLHPGVGPLTALAFVLIIGKADRFQYDLLIRAA